MEGGGLSVPLEGVAGSGFWEVPRHLVEHLVYKIITESQKRAVELLTA